MKNVLLMMFCIVFYANYADAKVYQNVVPKSNTWYKIKTRGRFLCQVTTSGSYAEHQEVAYLISGNYNTAEVTIISEYNYDHKYVDVQWGYIGDQHDRYLAFKSIPITDGISVNGLSIYDVADDDRVIELEEVSSGVIEINPHNTLLIDERRSRIGVGTAQPTEKLDICQGNISMSSTGNDAGDFIFKNSSNQQLGRIWSNNSGSSGLFLSSGDNFADMTIDSNGAIGIGTSKSGSWDAKLIVNNSNDYTKLFQLGAEGPTTWFMGIGDKSGNYFHIGENDNKRIVINKITGNVGIGISNSTPSAKLQVAGDILADEIRVEDIAANNLQLEGNIAANQITVKANGNTADFVFSDTYNLKDLTEVENYIKTHKHLPDIPSAEEMEAAGVNLAEMNKLLLQKVEELTLYIIKQDEKLTKQDEQLKEITNLKTEIKAIKDILNNQK